VTLQNSPTVFNKAAMMNVGFVEAVQRFTAMDCVMFHDVDHLLENDRALMNCGQQPHHYAAAMDEWNYRWVNVNRQQGSFNIKCARKMWLERIPRRINIGPLAHRFDVQGRIKDDAKI